MDKIKFLSAIESDFKYDRTIDFKEAVKQKKMEFSVGATLLLTDAQNIVGVHFAIKMSYNKKDALSYSVILTFHVEGWSSEINPNEENKDAIRSMEVVSEMLDITVGFLRGSMYVQTKNSPLEGFTVPIISIKKLQENLEVKKNKHTL